MKKRLRSCSWWSMYLHLNPVGIVVLNKVKDLSIGSALHVAAVLGKMKVVAIAQILLHRQNWHINFHILKRHWKLVTINVGLNSASSQVVKLVPTSCSGCFPKKLTA